MSPDVLRLLLIAILAVYAVGAAAQGITCRAGQQQMAVADLLFGRNIGGRLGVTEKRWARFVADEITPRFPDGLTVVDASGQWRDRTTQRIVRERSKLVTLIMPVDIDASEKLAAIAEAYKRRFRQQSVGIVIRPACVSF